jgi:hypothetical protein
MATRLLGENSLKSVLRMAIGSGMVTISVSGNGTMDADQTGGTEAAAFSKASMQFTATRLTDMRLLEITSGTKRWALPRSLLAGPSTTGSTLETRELRIFSTPPGPPVSAYERIA